MTFEIGNYDKGGMNAIAGDGKLTGAEVKKAQKDGWTVWDGYSTNDPVPTNSKETEQKEKKEYLNFDEFDKGGKNAIAGDGKLTGDEVIRANQAGYNRVHDGYDKAFLEQYPDLALREPGLAFGGLLRVTANNVENKFVRTLAGIVDLCISPITMPISMIQGAND